MPAPRAPSSTDGGSESSLWPEPECGAIRTLARFAAASDPGAWPEAVRTKAKACLLYGLAVGAAGAGTRLPGLAARMLDRTEPDCGKGTAHRLLDGALRPPAAAAFANAVLLHSRIQEDAHPAGHVGVVVLPAALAAAEHLGASGETLLAAIVAGYETALRIGRGHAASASRQGFRTTPLYGVIGAAAAASRLHRLSPERTADALSIAANLAGGLREFAVAGTDEYVLQAGSAARNGLTATWSAALGMRGAPSILEGPAGFLRAFGGADGGIDQTLTRELGTSFEMMAVTGKRWPVCQFHRGVIRSVIALRAEALAADASRSGGATVGGALVGESVGSSGAAVPPAPEPRRIRVTMHPFEAEFFGVRHAGPFESFSHTFMSAPFCAALAWVRGAVTLAGMHEFEDSRVLETVRRVEVAADSGRARYQPLVEIALADGRELARVDAEPDDVLDGTLAQGMTEALMTECGAPVYAARRLVEAVEALARGGGVPPVVGAACAAAREARAAQPPSGTP